MEKGPGREVLPCVSYEGACHRDKGMVFKVLVKFSLYGLYKAMFPWPVPQTELPKGCGIPFSKMSRYLP